jgi:tetratricopeptide (TPR) repeat protein
VENSRLEMVLCPSALVPLCSRTAVQLSGYAPAGDADEAARNAELVLASDPAQTPFPADLLAAAHCLRGKVWVRRGKREQARADFESALRLAPGHPAAQDGLRELGGA